MGRIGYDFDQFYEERHKLPEPDGVHCIICGGELPKYKRKYCSDQCYLNWYQSLHIRSWVVTRENIIKMDNRKCVLCGRKYCTFEVHHVTSISQGGDEFDIKNLITVCLSCHNKQHKKCSQIEIENYYTGEKYQCQKEN